MQKRVNGAYLVSSLARPFCTAKKLKQDSVNGACLMYLFAGTFNTTNNWCKFDMASDKWRGRG